MQETLPVLLEGSTYTLFHRGQVSLKFHPLAKVFSVLHSFIPFLSYITHQWYCNGASSQRLLKNSFFYILIQLKPSESYLNPSHQGCSTCSPPVKSSPQSHDFAHREPNGSESLAVGSNRSYKWPAPALLGPLPMHHNQGWSPSPQAGPDPSSLLPSSPLSFSLPRPSFSFPTGLDLCR